MEFKVVQANIKTGDNNLAGRCFLASFQMAAFSGVDCKEGNKCNYASYREISAAD
jgi:hypothetical protein